MAYEIINFTGNDGGIEALFAGAATQYSNFAAAILVFIYISIAGVGYFIQDRRSGNGNLFMWAAISGLITTTASFFLLLYGNIVNIEVVIILMLVTIVSALAFLISTRE